MRRLTRPSPAKINLTLCVLGTRPDGYHEIESLVARLSLCDTVTASARRDDRHTLSCSDPGLPIDERNLALAAARRLAEAVGCRRGVDLSLHKRIPVGSGLGGGSSNAATVLLLLNELWGLRLPRDELARIAAEIGADVPLFLFGPLCIIRGRGELVEEVKRPVPPLHVLLLLPRLSCSTPVVYAAWDRMGSRSQRPSVAEVVAKLDRPEELAGLLFNDLEEPALAAYPELRGLRDEISARCPLAIRMSGSGSAFYCLSADRELLLTAQRSVAGLGLPLEATPVSLGA